MYSVILGLGSNVGDRESYIDKAVSLISEHDMIESKQLSTLYENPAQTTYPQPDFLNACMEVATFLTPEELLDATEAIERDLDRNSKGGQDPRTIDIDMYGQGNATQRRIPTQKAINYRIAPGNHDHDTADHVTPNNRQ